MITRRALLAAAAAAPLAAAAEVDYAPVVPRPLQFPADHGAHPDFRLEWWYLTAVLGRDAGAVGLQVTFFRLRTPLATDNPSPFTARQLVIAHVALADPRRGALLVEERIEREGFGVDCAAGDTRIALDSFRFMRSSQGAFEATIAGRTLRVALEARPRQPLLLQGDRGYSLKGDPASGAGASYYYSQPQLDCTVQVDAGGRREELSGRAWLDHEWSSALLPAAARGWDWLGANLDDGSALTAFAIRAPGGAVLATYASLRAGEAGAATALYQGDAVRFEPLATWESPRTRARYPIAQRVTVGGRRFETRPLMPDQELDARLSSGIVSWEGASRLLEAGRAAGAGYLELTGYADRVAL